LSIGSVTNATSACGTDGWSAPEVSKLKKYYRCSDVYSFGLLMYCVLMDDLEPLGLYATAVPSIDALFMGNVAVKSCDFLEHESGLSNQQDLGNFLWLYDLIIRCTTCGTNFHKDRPKFCEIVEAFREHWKGGGKYIKEELSDALAIRRFEEKLADEKEPDCELLRILYDRAAKSVRIKELEAELIRGIEAVRVEKNIEIIDLTNQLRASRKLNAAQKEEIRELKEKRVIVVANLTSVVRIVEYYYFPSMMAKAHQNRRRRNQYQGIILPFTGL